jgi:hypothetical protein
MSGGYRLGWKWEEQVVAPQVAHMLDSIDFSDWKFTQHTIYSPDGRFRWWIGHGLKEFKDYVTRVPFLSLLTRAERKYLWKVLTKQLRRNAFKELCS